jgi:transcriptional regulator with XRE-family HTH domain
MITGSQIRAARAALGWSAEFLSEQSGISLRTLIRFEGADGVPPSRSQTLAIVMQTLQAAGIEFIGAPDDRPGIRIASPRLQD